MKKITFLNPFLFAFASIGSIFFVSSVIASPDQAIRPLLVFWAILILLIYPVYWVTRDWHWASILLSVIVVSFFTPSKLFQAEIATLGLAIFCYLAYLYIKRCRLRSYHMVNILNFVSILFVVIIMAGILNKASGLSISDIPQYNWNNKTMPAELVAREDQPDIYYIVFDGYGRADILDEYYDYNNSEFIERLRAKGFIIPPRARSNYPKTILSIPSTLNMNYISALAPDLQNKDTYYWWLMTPLIDHSDVQNMLEKIGYHSYSITTGWGLTDNPSTDFYYQPNHLVVNDFETMVLSITPLNFIIPLLSRIAYFPSFNDHRDLVLYNFSTLSAISKQVGHKYVFAHIISPHPPFVFDENGDALTPNYRYSFNDANDIALTDEEYREGYIKQLRFLNIQIEMLVDEILLNSKTPPIIILQADHGPGMLTDFRSSANTCLKERFSIFSAYYLPGKSGDVISDDITLVNSFRIVFNEYFDTNFDILPRYHYYYQDTIYLFHSEDVTSIVDTCTTAGR